GARRAGGGRAAAARPRRRPGRLRRPVGRRGGGPAGPERGGAGAAAVGAPGGRGAAAGRADRRGLRGGRHAGGHRDGTRAGGAGEAGGGAAGRARRVAARELLPSVGLGDGALRQIAASCAAFEVGGMRADIVMARAATALAAWAGRTDVLAEDVRQAALLALPHRRRRNPFDAPGLDEDKLDETL